MDAEAAHGSLEPLADTLGLGVSELARGVLRIANTKIVGAVRAITVEFGHDPKDFALLSFGGAGGLVAVDVARELGIPEVIIPPGQGAFSALGMLMADVQHDLARTSVRALSEMDVETVEDSFAAMRQEAEDMLDGEGFDAEHRLFECTTDVRYSGQEHSVTVPFPDKTADPFPVVEKEFTTLHARQYGHVMEEPIEVTTLRLRAVGLVDKPELPELGAGTGSTTPRDRRLVFGTDGVARDYALHAREDLRSGDVIPGPAVVTEHTATTVLHDGDQLEVGRYGELVIKLKHEGEESR